MPTVLAIEPEIALEGENEALRRLLGHLHQREVRDRHGHVSVLAKECTNSLDVVRQAEREDWTQMSAATR